MSNIIWVVGFPRSGNTWLARLLGDALDSPIDSRTPNHSQHALADEGFDRQGDYVIKQQHLREQPKEGQVVFIYRDPRDIVISIEYYWQVSRQEALDWVCKGRKANGGWPKFMELWSPNHNLPHLADTVVSYEHLLRFPELWMSLTLNDLDIIETPNDIEDAVGRQSFDNRKKDLSGLPFGETVQKRAMRKGVSGDWRTMLSDEDLEYCNKYLGDWLDRLGYDLER